MSKNKIFFIEILILLMVSCIVKKDEMEEPNQNIAILPKDDELLKNKVNNDFQLVTKFDGIEYLLTLIAIADDKSIIDSIVLKEITYIGDLINIKKYINCNENVYALHIKYRTGVGTHLETNIFFYLENNKIKYFEKNKYSFQDIWKDDHLDDLKLNNKLPRDEVIWNLLKKDFKTIEITVNIESEKIKKGFSIPILYDCASHQFKILYFEINDKWSDEEIFYLKKYSNLDLYFKEFNDSIK